MLKTCSIKKRLLSVLLAEATKKLNVKVGGFRLESAELEPGSTLADADLLHMADDAALIAFLSGAG